MNKNVEDKMVQQIEKNLSNHIDESLKTPAEEQPIVSFDYSNPISITRAEYIRQAREACLRQLSEVQSTARAYDSYYLEPLPNNAGTPEAGQVRPKGLFRDGYGYVSNKAEDVDLNEEDTRKEQAAFRFLILRMVCAIVLFLAIFIFDRFDLKIGAFTPDKIQEYVTGKDNLKELEEMLVTWLKE
jgi:hypothetical protein